MCSDDAEDDHTYRSCERRNEIRFAVVVPEPCDQGHDQREAGGEAGDFLKHDRQSADGMGDQAYREGDEH